MAGVTLQTVADRVGVSRMTVSNAFSRPDQLSAELRAKILAAAEELGYSGPDPAARALARGTTGAIGVMLTDSIRYAFTDDYATSFLGVIAGELAPSGRALTLLLSHPVDGADGPTSLVPARDVPMDGALVVSCDITSDAVAWLRKRRLPIVFIDQPVTPGIPSVNVDDRGGAEAAARHLVELGHRHVALVFASLDGPHGPLASPFDADLSRTATERVEGWLSVLDAAGATAVAYCVEKSDPDAGEAAGRWLLECDPRPTAALCYSDATAAGVIASVTAAGVQVPDELSVVGFDDSPRAAQLRPPLTTVRQDVAAKGREAVAALLAAIERSRKGAADGRAKHVVLPTELVVRASTAPPRLA